MKETSESKPDIQEEPPIDVEDLRAHVFDGIQEYDKRLPNWWLWTFYGAIIFAVWYWIIVHMMGLTSAADPALSVQRQLREARESAMKNSPELSDQKLWALSRDATTVAAGKLVYETTCASCHLADLAGQIGPNLRDTEWIHGGTPLEIAKTINDGVLAKGMPSWGPILGPTKIAEVTAYILSYHQEGEPIIIKPSTPSAPTAALTEVQ